MKPSIARTSVLVGVGCTMILVLATAAAERQASSSDAVHYSTTYEIPWYSINSGSSESAGGNYEANSTVGQVAVGEVSGGSYTASVGYWYGATASLPPSCACDCQGDENCDSVANVFDVVYVVSEAFRNHPYTPDPNPLCPLIGMNDLNLDDVVNVFDVVLLVNMAFRNGLREDNICDPCTGIGPCAP